MIDINKWIIKLLPYLVVATLSFTAGILWAVDASYDTGYKMAYLEIKQLLSQGSNGNQDFYISDMPFKFRPQRDRQAIQIVEIAGAGGTGRSIR